MADSKMVLLLTCIAVRLEPSQGPDPERET